MFEGLMEYVLCQISSLVKYRRNKITLLERSVYTLHAVIV